MKTHDTHTLLIFVRHQVSFVCDVVKDILDHVNHMNKDPASPKRPPVSPSTGNPNQFSAGRISAEKLPAEPRRDDELSQPPAEGIIVEAHSVSQCPASTGQQLGRCCCSDVKVMISEELVKLQGSIRDFTDQVLRGLLPSLEVLWEHRLRLSGDMATSLMIPAPPIDWSDSFAKMSHANSRSIPTRTQEVPAAFRNLQGASLSAGRSNDAKFQETIAMVVNSASKSAGTGKNPAPINASEPQRDVTDNVSGP